MEIPAIATISPAAQAQAALQDAALGKMSSGDQAKIADSCEQFESMLWRQLLEKSLQPLLHSPESNADKTGAYGFFMANTLAESVSGTPAGISSLLQAQLLKNPTISSES
jgi:hypothetical protein